MPIRELTPKAQLQEPHISDWLHAGNKGNPGHLPYRIRVLAANLPWFDREFGTSAPSAPAKNEDRTRRRCETDAIWEGRIAAMRWLIEFVGLKPCRYLDACDITCFPDWEPVSLSQQDQDFLLDMWTAATKATSHSTHANGHKEIENEQFERVLLLVMDHLDKTIYRSLGTTIRTEAFQPPPQLLVLQPPTP